MEKRRIGETPTMESSVFRLDVEQRNWAINCLRKSGIEASAERELCQLIEGSVTQFLAARAHSIGTDREAHDALRELWLLAHEIDPPVGQLRALVSKLPEKALSYINSRAVHLIPRLFPGQSAGRSFQAWARDAEGPDLVEAIRILSATGGQIVMGRSRGGGKRSRRKLEPMIAGQVRGTGDTAPKGGRPGHAEQDALVRNLAIDWYRATGQRPEAGRSDHTGFGDLVHSIFDWVGEPGAVQALRRYWAAVSNVKTRSIPGGVESF